MNKKLEKKHITDQTSEVVETSTQSTTVETPANNTSSSKKATPSEDEQKISEKPSTETTDETSTEDLKAQQKEVAEKEHKINQQLEILWSNGRKQMLSEHPRAPQTVVPSSQQKAQDQRPTFHDTNKNNEK